MIINNHILIRTRIQNGLRYCTTHHLYSMRKAQSLNHTLPYHVRFAIRRVESRYKTVILTEDHCITKLTKKILGTVHQSEIPGPEPLILFFFLFSFCLCTVTAVALSEQSAPMETASPVRLVMRCSLARLIGSCHVGALKGISSKDNIESPSCPNVWEMLCGCGPNCLASASTDWFVSVSSVSLVDSFIVLVRYTRERHVQLNLQ